MWVYFPAVHKLLSVASFFDEFYLEVCLLKAGIIFLVEKKKVSERRNKFNLLL